MMVQGGPGGKEKNYWRDTGETMQDDEHSACRWAAACALWNAV